MIFSLGLKDHLVSRNVFIIPTVEILRFFLQAVHKISNKSNKSSH
jgi:hypothetical protein